MAFEYAAQRDAGAGIVFEIQMGMIDRGASLQLLSQAWNRQSLSLLT